MEIDKTYKLRIRVANEDLTYTGTIIAIDDTFITFRDKFGKRLSYNKNNIISVEEVGQWRIIKYLH